MSSDRFTDIIVAIHGIGDQSRASTIRSVSTRFANAALMAKNAADAPVAPQPLGYFHGADPAQPSVHRADDVLRLGTSALKDTGFAEIYWADIPREVAAEHHTLEETKEWAATVVARAKARCLAAKKRQDHIIEPNFDLAAEVLDEIIDTVAVLENLTFLAGKAGVFEFELRDVLDDYLGDVQLVAEFTDYRARIIERFWAAMNHLYQQHCVGRDPQVRFHLVAHSEGTVVSFLALLLAMSEQDAKGGARPAPPWLKHVRGYMTIGSPIDKHLVLWSRLWQDLEPQRANELFRETPIRWRNYYDYGDPVGFKLDTARTWMKWRQLTAFEFEEKHDHGFARYPLPGKAHNDYWDDSEVFDHFIQEVVKDQPASKPPGNTFAGRFVSPLIPYLISAALLGGGVYLLYKFVGEFLYPEPGALEQYFLQQNNVAVEAASSGRVFARCVIGVAFLVGGTTLLARLPRLAAGWKWKAWAFVAFLIGCGGYRWLVPDQSREMIGSLFVASATGETAGFRATAGVCLLGLVVALIGLFATRKSKTKHRNRLLWRGMRPMILAGALGVAAVVIFQTWRNHASMGYVPPAVTPLVERPSPWPVVFAGLAFLYLWWLAALIFDLGFVWQRYVRCSVANDRLRQWEPYNFSKPRESRTAPVTSTVR